MNQPGSRERNAADGRFAARPKGAPQMTRKGEQGEFRFMTVQGRVNAGVFIDFPKRLVHNTDRPIFLIVDGHPSHKAKRFNTMSKALMAGWSFCSCHLIHPN